MSQVCLAAVVFTKGNAEVAPSLPTSSMLRSFQHNTVDPMSLCSRAGQSLIWKTTTSLTNA